MSGGHYVPQFSCPLYPESRHWRCTHQCLLRARTGHASHLKQPHLFVARSSHGLLSEHRSSYQLLQTSRGFRSGVDHLLHRGNLCRWKSADRSVFADNGLILGKIDTERLIVGDVALDPLNIWAELTQNFIRFRCRSPQLFAFECAHLWNITLNDELL